MKKVYVQAVLELLESGSNIETVLSNLRAVMTTRGHAKALPVVLTSLTRALEQQSDATAPTLALARASDEAALAADIKLALATLGSTTTPVVTIDDALIGGLIATYNHRQIDQSYRTKLTNLYQAVTN